MTLRRALIFRSLLTFFGLTSKHRQAIFTQVHEIVFHGKGGYSWSEVYNMPIWLRKFTFQSIQDYYNKRKEAEEAAYNKSTNTQTLSPKGPDIQPSYSTKASK